MPGALKWGTEFLVNSTTTNGQSFPTVAALTNGRFAVTFVDYSIFNTSAGPTDIRAQVFHTDGSKFNSEILVDPSNYQEQSTARIAALPGGGFVVVWSDESGSLGDTDGYALHAKIFNQLGEPVGEEFRVNSSTSGNQNDATIAVMPNGNFVVAWGDDDGADGHGLGIRGQLFDGTGAKIGDEFTVSAFTEGSQHRPDVSPTDDGFLAVWSEHLISDNHVISVQRFDSDAARIGTQIEVVVAPELGVSIPIGGAAVASLSADSFVVVWEQFIPSFEIKGRVYVGTAGGVDFTVNTTTADDQTDPQVAALPDGRFVVSWTDYSSTAGDTSGSAVRAQVFNADGTRSGNEFVVNTTTSSAQVGSSISVLPDGRFVIAWIDYSATGGDTSISATRAQIFDPRESAVNLTGDANGNELAGTPFDDTLKGGLGNDLLAGGAGSDLLAGGFGDDTLDGGAGSDTVSFEFESTGGVSVNLAIGEAEFADTLEVDKLINIENVVGTQSDDLLLGDNAINKLEGLGGNDELRGGDGADRLEGGEGNDTLAGEGGIDTVHGNGGDDTIEAIGGGDFLFGDDGVDTVDYSTVSAAFVIDLSAGTNSTGDHLDGIENIVGGSGGDTLTGDAAVNGLFGGDGNDILTAVGDGDFLNGGDDSDTLTGGSGSTHIFGGDGDDHIVAGAGQLQAYGADGNDTIEGGSEDDWLEGDNLDDPSETGNDIIDGGDGADLVVGGPGNDSLRGGTGDDVVFGGNGSSLESLEYFLPGLGASNIIYEFFVFSEFSIFWETDDNAEISGDSGDDTLFGSNGNDHIYGGVGADKINGGGGDDVIDAGADSAVDQLLGGAGNDRLIGSLNDFLVGGDGIDTIDFSALSEDIVFSITRDGVIVHDDENYLGGSGKDDVTGNPLDNRIEGNAGNDTLKGGEGADTLIGGANNDILQGGAGKDDYIGGDGIDEAVFSDAAGDTFINLATGQAIVDGQTETLSGIENVTGSAHKDQITGDNSDNIFKGGGDQDRLTGAQGNDFLYGEDGGDILKGGIGNDTLDGGEGIDRADYSESATAVNANIDTGIATGEGTDTLVSIEALVGSNFNDTLTGDFEDNIIHGGAGDDIIAGGEGIDELLGQDGFDTVSYAGALVGMTVNLTSGLANENGSNDFETVSGFESIIGSDFGDVLIGAGNDEKFKGGEGNDTITGGEGDDTIVYGGEGTDTIFGFLAGNGTPDKLEITAGFATFGEFFAAAQQVGADTEIDFGGGNKLILKGVNRSDLRPEDTNLDPTGFNIDGTDSGETISPDTSPAGQRPTSPGNDTIHALGGSDTVDGGDGDDTLDGGAGDDSLIGGRGNDTFVVDSAGDAVTELADGGNDLVRASISFSLAQLLHIENVTLTGTAAINATGNGSANVLIGNDGANVLTGAGGSDALTGGLGNDTFVYDGQGADVITDFAGGAGIGDVIQVTSVYTSFAQVLAHAHLVNGGNDTEIDFGGGNKLTLSGFNGTLSQNDFAFPTIVTGPEISVFGNGVGIADNDTTPSFADHTDFGTIGVGAPATRTFTVTNDGTSALTLSKLKMPKGFTLTEGLSSSLAPGASDSFTVTIDTKKAGLKTGAITFTTNDADEGAFNFQIGGNVVVLPSEIEVRGNGVLIVDNDTSPSAIDDTDFGNVAVGSTAIHTFTVNNTGPGTLTLSKLKAPKGFKVIDPLSTSIASGGSDTFQVQVDTKKLGLKTGALTFATNDPDETPFNFNLSANVTAAPLTADSTAASSALLSSVGFVAGPEALFLDTGAAAMPSGIDDIGGELAHRVIHHFDLV